MVVMVMMVREDGRVRMVVEVVMIISMVLVVSVVCGGGDGGEYRP